MFSINILAFDFGASSGRAMIGNYDGISLKLNEIHRFPNEPATVTGSLYWNIYGLYNEIKKGLLIAKNTVKDISSLAIDTWGVDYGLLDKNGKLINNPYHYRDTRTKGLLDEVFSKASKTEIFDETGIQFMWFNTIYQLYAAQKHEPHIMDIASSMLLMPDLFNYFLTGEKRAEQTIASTTQLFNPNTHNWSDKLISKLGLNQNLFCEIVNPGQIIGELNTETTNELGIHSIPVIAGASHDTASAVASVPFAKNENAVYISCGTWSLMGIETPVPIINNKSYSANYTNEVGVCGTIRFLKNIMGLWLVQECKRQWEREGKKYSYAELSEMAKNSKIDNCIINVEDDIFSAPGDMPKRIVEYCKNNSLYVPKTEGEIILCVELSLAVRYKEVFNQLEEIYGKSFDCVRMVGGGIQDRLLCQLTANAINKPVYAGPIEATALGNIITQLISLGELKNINQARELIKRSFTVETYEPHHT